MMEVVVTTAAKTSKAAVKSPPPTNQKPTFYRPDAVPVAYQQCQSTERKAILSISGTRWHYLVNIEKVL